jgi:hypothetical protein
LYYPLAVFLITTPLFHLAALFTGLTVTINNTRVMRDPRTILVMTGLATPFILLILPLSPAHDGIRYLLPAFPFAVCFMTAGLLKAWRYITRRQGAPGKGLAVRSIVVIMAVALFGADLHSPARYPPFELSYYNQLVGGVAGARRRGFETTYWWEVLNRKALEKVNVFCRGQSVYFPVPPTDLFFKQMKAQGRIVFEPAQKNPEKAEYMLILGRPYVKYWERKTWPLFQRAGKIPEPVWEITLDSVPLLRLYRLKQK